MILSKETASYVYEINLVALFSYGQFLGPYLP